MNKFIVLLFLLATTTSFGQIKIGEKVPQYVFKDVLNGDKKPFDTTHHDLFKYPYIPYTILIDKNGIIKAITTPDQINNKIIEDFVAGKEIEIIKKQDRPTNLGLFKEYKNQFYQYTLTGENKELEWKNEITRETNNASC